MVLTKLMQQGRFGGDENSRIVANRADVQQPPLKRRKTITSNVGTESSGRVFYSGLPAVGKSPFENFDDFVTPDRKPGSGMQCVFWEGRAQSSRGLQTVLKEFKNIDWKVNLKPWDRKVAGDAQYCAELADEIYHNLFKFDASYLSLADGMLDPKYLDKRGYRITPRMRAMLVDWLVEVLLKWRITDEALHLCISLLDRFLSNSDSPIEVAKLQLVGVCCAMIASKLQNPFSPEIESLMRICDGAYEVCEIEQMEHVILRTLDYRLDLPTAWTYLARWCQVFGLRKHYREIAAYLLDLTLLEYEALKYRPAVLALACTWVVVRMKRDRKKHRVAGATLEEENVLEDLGISSKELDATAHFITVILSHHRRDSTVAPPSETRNLNAVTRKYESEDRLAVARRIE